MQEGRKNFTEVRGRDVAALLDPRPTLIVGSTGHRDEVGFATIIWATPVSHEPPMVAFALRERSHTMSCIQRCGAFSLNVLPPTPEGVFLCEQVGTRTGFQFNKNVVVKHKIVEFEYAGCVASDSWSINAGGSAGSRNSNADDEIDEGDRMTIKEMFASNSVLLRALSRKKSNTNKRSIDTELSSSPADASKLSPAEIGNSSPALKKSKVPVVNMATSYLLCNVCDIAQAGDHLLVTGQVQHAFTTAPRNATGALTPTDALLCVQHGCYGKVNVFSESN